MEIYTFSDNARIDHIIFCDSQDAEKDQNCYCLSERLKTSDENCNYCYCKWAYKWDELHQSGKDAQHESIRKTNYREAESTDNPDQDTGGHLRAGVSGKR